jgi:hypothetical protein
MVVWRLVGSVLVLPLLLLVATEVLRQSYLPDLLVP